MNIALDFDETYTLDRPFWDRFIGIAKDHGHRVYMITCRRNISENHDLLRGIPVHQTYFTNHGSKLDFVKQLGLKIDVWIDDDPKCVIHGK